MSFQENGEQLSAISASQTPRLVGRISRIFVWLFILAPILMLFLPWQQNVNGVGYVSAFAPIERQQTIESPVSGRIIKWHVKEGARVSRGDLLVEVTDIDPLLPERLKTELEAYQIKLGAKEQEYGAYELQIERLKTVREMKVAAAKYKLDMARQKMQSADESVASEKATVEAAGWQETRLQRLLEDGLVSRRDFELAARDATVARRNLNSAVATRKAAQAEMRAAEADVDQLRASAQSKIESATARIKKILSEIQDIRNSLISSNLKIARQSAQRLIAPRAGSVLRLLRNPQSNIVKQGDPLMVLVPTTQDRAVEVWVAGNDAPLILPGHHARLMFEGWPAVQFVGWPEVAVGTFGGTVAFVDASDNSNGKFRILIVPDESDHPWPSDRFLRQGGAVKAWILLQQVSLGYEIWRQLNGFPPMLTSEHPYQDLNRSMPTK